MGESAEGPDLPRNVFVSTDIFGNILLFIKYQTYYCNCIGTKLNIKSFSDTIYFESNERNTSPLWIKQRFSSFPSRLLLNSITGNLFIYKFYQLSVSHRTSSESKTVANLREGNRRMPPLLGLRSYFFCKTAFVKIRHKKKWKLFVKKNMTTAHIWPTVNKSGANVPACPPPKWRHCSPFHTTISFSVFLFAFFRPFYYLYPPPPSLPHHNIQDVYYTILVHTVMADQQLWIGYRPPSSKIFTGPHKLKWVGTT